MGVAVLRDRAELKFSRAADMLYDRDKSEYYCLRCSFTGDEQEILRLNAQFRAKYRDRTKRITDF